MAVEIPASLKAKTLGLPRWIWGSAIGGGLIIGLYIRRRKAAQDAVDNASDEAVAEETPYDSALYGSDLFTPPYAGAGGYSGDATTESTYGDTMSTAFDIARVLNETYRSGIDLGQSVQASASPPFDMNAYLESITGAIQAIQPPAVTVTIPETAGGGPPTAPPRSSQVAAPRPTKPGNYHAGSTVKNGAGTVSRTFNGASGWIQLEDKSNQYADFHVAYPGGRLERWRGWGKGSHVPKGKRGTWEKIWTGDWR